MEADVERIRELMEEGAKMRYGRTLKRTLYLTPPETPRYEDHLCVGIVDSPELAEEICARWNTK